MREYLDGSILTIHGKWYCYTMKNGIKMYTDGYHQEIYKINSEFVFLNYDDAVFFIEMIKMGIKINCCYKNLLYLGRETRRNALKALDGFKNMSIEGVRRRTEISLELTMNDGTIIEVGSIR